MKKGAHKLTQPDILEIVTMYNSGLNHHQIAEEFFSSRKKKISRRHISAILQGKRWKKEVQEVQDHFRDIK